MISFEFELLSIFGVSVAAFSCADERDCDDTCGSQDHMVPISGNGSDGRIAVFVSRNTDYR